MIESYLNRNWASNSIIGFNARLNPREIEGPLGRPGDDERAPKSFGAHRERVIVLEPRSLVVVVVGAVVVVIVVATAALAALVAGSCSIRV